MVNVFGGSFASGPGNTPTGCYELKAINAEIIRIRGKVTFQFFQMSTRCNV